MNSGRTITRASNRSVWFRGTDRACRFIPGTDWRAAIRRLALALIVVHWGAIAVVEAASEPFLSELRTRRLFAPAEAYLLHRLESDKLGEEDRLDLLIELSKLAVERAHFLVGDEQTAQWKRAVDVLAAPSENASLTVRPRLLLQHGLVGALRAEFLEWESRLQKHDERLFQRANEETARAVQTLDELAAAAMPRSTGKDVDRTEETAASNRLRLLQASLLTLQAERRSEAKLEAAAADAVESILKRIVNAGSGPAAEAKRIQAAMLRIGGSVSAARKLAESLVDSSVRDAATAELVRCDMAEQRWAEALQRLQSKGDALVSRPPELDLLELEVLDGAREAAHGKRDVALAKDLLDRQRQVWERIRDSNTGIWVLRASWIWRRIESNLAFGKDLAGQTSLAEARATQQDWTGAATAYRAVFDVAVKEKAGADVLWQLASVGGSCWIRAGQFDRAAEQFDVAEQALSGAGSAGDAHLMRCFALGRAYSASRTRDRREAYAKALIEHQTRYRERPSRFEAAWLLARLEEDRQQLQQAMPLYRAIPGSHARFAAAQAALARCQLALCRRAGRDADLAATVSIKAFDELATGLALLNSDPAGWDLDRAELSLTAGLLEFQRTSPDVARAAERIDRARVAAASSGASNDSPERRAVLLQRMNLWRFASQSLLGSVDNDGAGVDELVGAHPTEALSALATLTMFRGQVPPSARKRFENQWLDLANAVERRRASLDPANQLDLDEYRLAALLFGREYQQGEQILARLNGDRKTPAAALRRALLTVDEGLPPSVYGVAAKGWQALESARKPGSAEWLEARSQRLLCQLRSGQTDAARELWKLTKLLYPRADDPATQARFDRIDRLIIE